MSVTTSKAVEKMALTGNEAGAQAFRQINPDVAGVFPITPQTELMHAFAGFVADGLVDTELITVESEHSAMSACVGAAAAGARVITATSSNGLALMWEILYIAASLRLPIIMATVNRALSGPINIHNDHSDSMGARDSGWIQLFCENAQEVYDTIIQSVRIAEHPDVLLPVMVCFDGFIISHGVETVQVYDDATVKKFIGEYTPLHPLLDVEHPKTYGPLDLQDYYFEHKRQQYQGMKNSHQVIREIAEEFSDLFGTKYDYFETYRLEDAEAAILALGSTAGTSRVAVDELRAEGHKVGLLKLRTFRPFPYAEVAWAARHLKALLVMDKSDSFGGQGGPVFMEVRSALCDLAAKPLTKNYIYGLGGRDINVHQLKKAFGDILEVAHSGKVDVLSSYYGIRE